jgi:hypothetical protein
MAITVHGPIMVQHLNMGRDLCFELLNFGIYYLVTLKLNPLKNRESSKFLIGSIQGERELQK